MMSFVSASMAVHVQMSPQLSGFFFSGTFLGFGSNERPDFVTLDAGGVDIANVLVVERCARIPELYEKLTDRVLRETCEPHGAPDAVPFHERGYNAGAVRLAQLIHFPVQI
jgi:hypothetical protein